MARTLLIILPLMIVNVCWASEFEDDFTNNAYTQANWTFLSPYDCLNPAFTASATASDSKLCVNSPTPADPFETLALGYVNQPFDAYDVSVYAGISFTAAELTGTARITKSIILRYDPRQSPILGQFGCSASTDGGDLYFCHMDPQSGGENRFSIRKYVGGIQDPVITGPSYVWPADVQHNVYFGISWDPVEQTNVLRAILYLENIHNPLVDLVAVDDSIKPGNVDPGNNNNKYAGILVSDDNGGPINNVCLTVPSHALCPTGVGKFVVHDSIANFDGGDSDGDNDGVTDGCDLCPNTIPGALVDGEGCPPIITSDFDRDGDVDSDDLSVLASCRTRAAVPIVEVPSCAKADFDNDQDVDQDDFGVYQRCYSGMNNAAQPNCGD